MESTRFDALIRTLADVPASRTRRQTVGLVLAGVLGVIRPGLGDETGAKSRRDGERISVERKKGKKASNKKKDNKKKDEKKCGNSEQLCDGSASTPEMTAATAERADVIVPKPRIVSMAPASAVPAR